MLKGLKLRILLSLCGKKFTAYPSFKQLTFAQCKHEPKVKAVRVNDHFTEVKQSALRIILRWVTIHFVSFSLAMIGRNIRQIK